VCCSSAKWKCRNKLRAETARIDEQRNYCGNNHCGGRLFHLHDHDRVFERNGDVSALLPELRTLERQAAILRLRTRYLGPQLRLVAKEARVKKKQPDYPKSISPHPSHIVTLGLVPDITWQPWGCMDDTFKVIVRNDAELARPLAPR
jgi:hypothetical protein